jgi:anti-sigma regulatory factor (Ser/Thr protein kinase)
MCSYLPGRKDSFAVHREAADQIGDVVGARGVPVRRAELPCLPSMVPVARRLARGLLADCPRTDDAELVLSELAGNTVRYGRDAITVSVTTGSGWARLAVTDAGPEPETPAGPPRELDDFEERGHGLLIVDRLAERWGHDRELDGRNVLWAELRW